MAACGRAAPPAPPPPPRFDSPAAPAGVAEDTASGTRRAAPADPGSDPAARPSPLRFPGVDRPHDALLRAIAARAPTELKPVGTSSLVYRMRLEGDVDAAFRPRTRTHPRGHLAEVAAYRIARLLGVEHVPPAISRRLSRDDTRRLLRRDLADQWPALQAETLWEPDGTAWGAAIFWIPEMRNLGLDAGVGLAGWTAALRQSEPAPVDERAMHADLSRMVALDYLIGNPDRFSGSNVKGLPGPGSRVFVRDHNLAFLRPFPRRLHERVRRHLGRAERFSRRFVDALLELDEARLRAALAEDPAPAPILDDARIADVLDRREALLSYIVALVDRWGEERVLAFD